MTPKEKAREIFDKYWLFFVEDTDAMGIHKLTKQCAIIAVDEVINSNPHSNPLNTHGFSTMAYWLQVKHEINNL